ncbi:EamA family transporter [Archaeoglobus veneficus]|uniref:EamA domain-containing protein n=1 Tax=Archaeoglobus veneficus (strain DSM 11195 / SNP6) TaxID=693661 RepID=F2KMP0_ARCVS|nr:EamA family transporter [Archaeoglobus veneficus]AEA47237.1 protein of unknown function DUF6 transmembrane [Archaeoglobus veneficus SNP6]
MKGELLAILAALLWGIAPILDKLAIADAEISPVVANIIRSLGALTVLALIAVFLQDFSFSEFTPKRIAYLLTAGSIAGGIAMIIFYLALKQIGASKTVPLTSIYPLFAVIFSVVLLGEQVDVVRVAVGTVLIVSGIIFVMTG